VLLEKPVLARHAGRQKTVTRDDIQAMADWLKNKTL